MHYMEYEEWEDQMYAIYCDLENDGQDLTVQQLDDFKAWIQDKAEEGMMVGVYE